MSLWVLLLIPVVLGPPVIARIATQHRRRHDRVALESLRAIAAAQARFRAGDLEGDRILDYATSLAELGAGGSSIPRQGTGSAASAFTFSNPRLPIDVTPSAAN